MTANSKTPVSGNHAIDALLVGRHWGFSLGANMSLTYSIPQGESYWVSDYQGGEPGAGWGGLNATQISSFRHALAAWSEVANIQFNEVPDGQTYGEIRVAFSQAVTEDPNVAGWAYVPSGVDEAGDIWLSNSQDRTSLPGSSGYATFLHEIGHAIGLSHPFEVDTDNGALLIGVEDSSKYTLMAYNDYAGVGETFIATADGSYSWYPANVTSPMLYDIQAIQYLYGANLSTRSGDDVYTFSASEVEFKTIWDAGGSDTFDLSNQTVDLKVDLNAGQFSSIGIKETWNNGIVSSAAIDNIAIAYQVLIENVIGGKGHDELIGNSANNQLEGSQGNDTLIGGAGTDTAIFNETFNQYTVVNQGAGQLQVISAGVEGIDTLMSIERLQFSDQTILSSTFTTSSPNPEKAGNDNFTSISGDGIGELFDGGDGIDTVTFDIPKVEILKTITGFTVGQDTLVNIERLHFTDISIALDTDGPNSAGGIYRTYQAAFDRAPDTRGFGYWIDRADHGASAVQMAEEFVGSQEFQSVYDVITADSYLTGNDREVVVDGLYRNVLGRDPDQGGLDYYTRVIESEEKTVGRVLAEMADSIENRDNLLLTIENGMQYDFWLG